ncbi:hypothetical protein Leryth_010230 [Lithospermum erythrorhizon]|nr:hypothetical protein Leryth_010230 [Lithospermum erythrorhizon]
MQPELYHMQVVLRHELDHRQVEALERLYYECPKPSSIRRQQLIRECPILSNIEPKQIKVWFQNRRCREKQRKEASRLQAVNRKLTAMNKLLMEENDRLQKQVSHLTGIASKDTSCESVVTSGQHCSTSRHPPRDAGPAGLLSIAEETLTEFLSKATGTAVEWVQMPGMKLYAPTTLAPARDFCLIRYTSILEDGSLVVCERSLSDTQNGNSMPPVQTFVRAEMLPSGYLVRPCEGGGSIIHIVDHVNLEAWSVPEVLRSLYESSSALAQRATMAALRQLRQVAQEVTQTNVTNWGRRPAALRALSQRLSRGFNEALNGFNDEGWTLMGNDGMDDITILVNSSPEKLMGLNLSFSNGFAPVSNAVMCLKASMLLQNVPPAILLRFLREHRSEWADNTFDAYSAAAVKVGPHSLPGSRMLEVVKLEGVGHPPEDMMPRDVLLLQLCSGMDENAMGSYAELIFAPIDGSFADDAPLLPSGFRIIPLDSRKASSLEASSPNRTLDLASSLEAGAAGSKSLNDPSVSNGATRSVMTMAFEFAFESHMQENVASMARQYIRNIISSVQRVALALSPSHLGPHGGLRPPLGTPEAHTLAQWICQSYRCYMGVDLLTPCAEGSESFLKSLWNYSDAIMCYSLKALPVFTFANQAGLDMLETTLVALQDITLEKIFDDHGRKSLYSEYPQIMQQDDSDDDDNDNTIDEILK